MKYLKYFEDENIEPKVGDYVIMKERFPYVFDYSLKLHQNDLLNFITNNIGKIQSIDESDYDEDETCVCVEYENIPNDLVPYFTTNFPDHLKQNLLIFRKNHVETFDSNKEKLEIKLSAKKYNL